MRRPAGIIALDLDGTLLNSQKRLSRGNAEALERAAAAGYEIVPTTGRFYGGMPQEIRDLPFVRYVITINGAAAEDLQTGRVIYKAELPWWQAVEIMALLDRYPVIYDCYQGNAAWMTAAQKELIDQTASNPHCRKMLHELRQPVPELKLLLLQRRQDVQKIQFFTKYPELRLQLMDELPSRFRDLCISSSVGDNVEINQIRANKGEALLELARHLQIPRENVFAFGDGLNDLSMLKEAGVGIAMENACPQAKAAADRITLSCDEDGVAFGIDKFCLN